MSQDEVTRYEDIRVLWAVESFEHILNRASQCRGPLPHAKETIEVRNPARRHQGNTATVSVIQPETRTRLPDPGRRVRSNDCLVISTVPSHDADTSCLGLRVRCDQPPFPLPVIGEAGQRDPGFDYVVVHDLDRVGHTTR